MIGTSSFGVMCKKIRKKKGLSQRAVAYRGGIDASEVNRIESEQRRPQLRTLEGLAKGLNIAITVRPDGLFIRDLDEEE